MKIGRIIDLTGPLHEGTQALATPSLRYVKGFGGVHKPVRYEVRCTYEEVECMVMAIEFDGEEGTCLIAPGTGNEGYAMIEDLPLEDLCGDARVIYIPKKSEESVSANEVKKAAAESGYEKGEILLLRTGWGDSPEIYAKWYNKEYVTKTPVLTKEASQAIVDLGVKTFGTDMSMLCRFNSTDYKEYKILDQKLINMMLCLINLNAIGKSKVTFIGLALKVEMPNCPMRAIAIED